MNAVKQGNSVLESYACNHRGERVLRTPAGGAAQITLYDEVGLWLGNYSATGQAQQQAIWLDDYPVALINVPATGVPELAYVQPDHLGTPRVVIDPVRNVAIWEWSNKSEVFGNQIPSADPDGDGVVFELALRFPGQQATDASGLFYNYQREYDPAVGRYSQSDPIGLLGGIGTYSYVGGNPLIGLDSLGLCEQTSVCRTLPGMSGFSEAARAAYLANPSSPLDKIWPFSVLRGTRIHVQFAFNVKALGGPYDSEVSYLNGIVVDYGTPGSVRADGIYGPRAYPKYVVELKSGAAGLTAAEIRNYYTHLPKGTILCGVLERSVP